MKVNPDLKLRKLGSKYIIVQSAADQVDMSNVYTLNSTAAYLFEHCASAAGIDITPDLLAGWLMEEYGIDESLARKDADDIFAVWAGLGLLF